MNKKIYQYCYTNYNGWKPVACSMIPNDLAYDKNVFSINSNMSNIEKWIDEDGNSLNLFEIESDENCIYILRTQYNVNFNNNSSNTIDDRRNNFVHGYFMKWEDGPLKDPNIFLTLKRNNFKVSVDEAQNQLKADLEYMPSYNIDTALKQSKLTKECYITLIQSIYTQLMSSNNTPLFIQYDGSDENIASILYCIYYGLPNFLKKKLKVAVAGVNPNKKKNIVFSKYATQKPLYFVPKTGENNILSDRSKAVVNNLGYVDYIAKHVNSIDGIKFSSEFDKMILSLGSRQYTNKALLKVAFTFLTQFDIKSLNNKTLVDWSNEQLNINITDALLSQCYGNELMENYISKMLEMYMERHINLYDDQEKYLQYYFNNKSTENFEKAVKRYKFYRFEQLDVDTCAKKLSTMEEKEFEFYSNNIGDCEKGQQVLNLYFKEYIYNEFPLSWDLLQSILDKAKVLPNEMYDEICGDISCRAFDLYEDVLKVNPNIDIYENYILLMKRVTDSYRISSFELESKVIYWKYITFKHLNLIKKEEFYSMALADNEKSQAALLYIDIMENCINEDETIFKLKYIYDVYKDGINNHQIIQDLCDNLQINSKNEIKKLLNHFADEDDKVFKQCVELKKYILYKKYDVAIEIYDKLILKVQNQLDFNSYFISVCESIDRTYDIPVDMWITLGKSKYSNPFEIFEDVDASILHYSKEDIVSFVINSNLLKENEYLEFEKEYINLKVSNSQIVKKWYKIARDYNKKKSKSKTDSRKKGIDNIIDLFVDSEENLDEFDKSLKNEENIQKDEIYIDDNQEQTQEKKTIKGNLFGKFLSSKKKK